MIFDGKVYREETPEEIKGRKRREDEEMNDSAILPAPPTEAERLEALENWQKDFDESYRMGVNAV